MPETRYCAKHPTTESNLTCGRCDKPICPQCMVHAPVGLRCEDCANLQRLPTFNVSTGYLVRAIGVGLALAIAGGVFWSIFAWLARLGTLLDNIAIVGLAYLIAEGISITVNRKRGRGLKFVAAGSVVVAAAIVLISSGTFLNIFDLLAVAIAIYVATGRFK